MRNDRYRTIFEATTDAVVVIDLDDGTIVDANQAVCDMFGYGRDELIGFQARNLTHPDERQLVTERFQQLAEKGGSVPLRRARGIRKDGSVFYTESRGAVFEDAGRRLGVAVDRDVTEQVEAEQRLSVQAEQLREKEEQYRSIFESTLDALFISDRDANIVEANPAACRLFGYRYEDFLSLRTHELIHPEDFHVWSAAVEAVTSGSPFRGRSRCLRQDGTVIHVEGLAAPFAYRGETHFLSVVRNVTERVHAEGLLREKEDQLEQRVEERTRELSALLDVSRNVTSTLELQPLLDLILEQLAQVVEYTGAGISVQESEEIRIIGYRGLGPVSRQIALGTRVPVSQVRELWDLMRRGEPLIIPDVQGDSAEAQIYRNIVGDDLSLEFAHTRSWMAVPMRIKDRDLGDLFLEHGEANAYTPHHADLALAIAQQAAIAIENARLYERAQELAVLEERQRLSRELHDSVSQALYSIALGAKTARAKADRDPRGAIEPLDFVLVQAERGLAEMRALIFELRPEALEQEGLAGAL
jgi:PAS domain S-box-containing protein